MVVMADALLAHLDAASDQRAGQGRVGRRIALSTQRTVGLLASQLGAAGRFPGGATLERSVYSSGF